METSVVAPEPESSSRTEIDDEADNISRDVEHFEIVRSLRLELSNKNSECEALKIQLCQRDQTLETLSQELNECRLTMFEDNEDSKKNCEEIGRFKKLEEDYVKLMRDYLDFSEESAQYKRDIYDTYLAKTNAINNYECLMSSNRLMDELRACQTDLNDKLAELELTVARIRDLEEENSIKEKTIAELRRTLDDAKVTHHHEITVLEEYIQCLKNTVSSYEKTLVSYMKHQPEDPSEDKETCSSRCGI